MSYYKQYVSERSDSKLKMLSECEKEKLSKGRRYRNELNRRMLDAAWMGEVEVVQDLLSLGVDVDARDSEHDETALMLASRKNHTQIAEYLINSGANVHATDRFGKSALSYASRAGANDIIRILINHGSAVDATDDDGNSSLFHAITGGHNDTTLLLINSGANVNRINLARERPLDVAESDGAEPVIDILKQHGAIRSTE